MSVTTLVPGTSTRLLVLFCFSASGRRSGGHRLTQLDYARCGRVKARLKLGPLIRHARVRSSRIASGHVTSSRSSLERALTCLRDTSLDCASTCHFIADEGTTRTRVPDEDTPSSHVWYVCLVRYTPSHVWHVPSEDTPSHVCHFDDYRTRQGRTRQRRTINVTFACLALC